MANIETWSTTAALNNSASPNGWPENMSSAGLNDSAREMMAALRRWYADPEWLNLNYGATVTRDSATQLTVAGVDATTWFTAGRRVKVVGTTTGYGFVVSSSYSSPNTAVTVTMDAADVPTSPTLALVHHSATLSQSAFVGIPTGCCLPYSGAVANIPGGFLLADGSEVSKTTYAALWAAFGGHLYGTPSSPSTHFLLPDMGGRVTVGYDAGDADYSTVGNLGGSKTLAIASASTANESAHVHQYYRPADGANADSYAGSAHSHSVNLPVESGGAHENRQPYVAMAYIVKT